MNNTPVSRYAHLFVRPRPWATPVFRDLSPNAHRWPVGAVFSVAYQEKDWPHLKNVLAPVVFFGEDGWPLDFPAEKKRLGAEVRAYVQTDVPRGWRWHLDTPEQWERAERNPTFLAELADGYPLLRPLLRAAPPPQLYGDRAEQQPARA